MTSTSYRVDGLTCGHCVSAITQELNALADVNAVTVDLEVGRTSTVTVTSSTPLTNEQVAAALEEAGDYRLVEAAS